MDPDFQLWDVLAELDTSNTAAAAAEGGADASGTETPPPNARAIAEPSTPSKRASPTELSIDLDPNMDPQEAKRVKRMKRNRESAAMSRERKKLYIEELVRASSNRFGTLPNPSHAPSLTSNPPAPLRAQETKLAALNATVQRLQAENEALRSGRAPLEGATPATDKDSSDVLPPLVPQSDNDSESDSLDAFLQQPFLPAEPAPIFCTGADSLDKSNPCAQFGRDLAMFKDITV